MINKGIYLDYNATTPCDPRVVEKMLPYFTEIYGNPSNGLHQQGRRSAKAVDEARQNIASLIGASAKEIVFTAGATESNNLAILGLARSQARGGRKRIVTSAVEHKSVLAPCNKLADAGFDIVILPVDSGGRVVLEAARQAITEDTLLVSVQLANNEVGTLHPVNELSAIAHSVGSVFHCDATQAIGKIPVDLYLLGVDIGSMSAHKLYGPKGVGALFVSRGIRSSSIEPIIYGGGQENGMRSGTTNVPAIVGFGEACALANNALHDEKKRICTLRDLFEKELSERIPEVTINGKDHDRLPNTSSLTFNDVDADALIMNLNTVMVGTGSACSSGAIGPSHVLEAMGLSRDQAHSTIRVSMGRFTNEQEIVMAVEDIDIAFRKLYVK